jgi:4-carboxymuconolactone decarboxylase
MDEAERHELGLATRRAVLGDAYVDRAMNTRTAFNAEFQDVLNRQCWGEVWTRTAIDRQTRRLITIGMLIALNREDEFRTHVRTALEHGVDPDLIKEVILHSVVYCGVPAANSAFKAAGEILAELTSDK